MNKEWKITHVKNHQVNYEKWDTRMQGAGNRNLYGKSWYLDIVSPGWEALICGDYEYIMPLPVKNKFGVKAVVQPLHCQQLGIFPAPVHEELQTGFCNTLFRLSPIIHYQFNAGILFPRFGKLNLQQRSNYILAPEASSRNLLRNYRENTRRNIQKAKKMNVRVVSGLQPGEFFLWKKQAVNRKIPEASEQILKRLMSRTLTSGQGEIFAAYEENNTLCAAAFIVYEGKKAYYLNAFSTAEGFMNSAMFLIVHELIKKCYAANLSLDFEGSVIPGVARFYKNFGATPEIYYYTCSPKNPFPWLKTRITS